jgi:hypothetical protein
MPMGDSVKRQFGGDLATSPIMKRKGEKRWDGVEKVSWMRKLSEKDVEIGLRSATSGGRKRNKSDRPILGVGFEPGRAGCRWAKKRAAGVRK